MSSSSSSSSSRRLLGPASGCPSVVAVSRPFLPLTRFRQTGQVFAPPNHCYSTRKGKYFDVERHAEESHLQTTTVEPMGAVSYFQEFVVGLILNIQLDQRRVSYGVRANAYIIQTDRTPLVAPRSGPFTILARWEV